MANTARTRRLYPIAPLPRHVITPLPRDFKPNMYKDPRVYILNPVFNFIVEEKSVQELNCCCICLENKLFPYKAILSPCKHDYFCKTCIETINNYNSLEHCPLCRMKITKVGIIIRKN